MSKPFSDLTVANLVVKFGDDGDVESIHVSGQLIYVRILDSLEEVTYPVEVSRQFGQGSDVDRDAKKCVPDTSREVLIKRKGLVGYLVGRSHGGEWYLKDTDKYIFDYVSDQNDVIQWREI